MIFIYRKKVLKTIDKTGFVIFLYNLIILTR